MYVQESRKLTMFVPISDIEKMRKLLQKDESITDLVKRLIKEAVTNQGSEA
jgi:hypothetical protein